MTPNAPTDWDDNPAPDFASTGVRLVLRTHSGHRQTYVYTPSEAAKAWDGVDATHCLGSQFGIYPYANIKVTGRKPRIAYGMRAFKARVEVGLEYPDDRQTVDAWIIADDHPLEIIKARLGLE